MIKKIPFPQSRDIELKQYVREQRNIQREHLNNYKELLKQLDSKGVDISKVKEILGALQIDCLRNQRSFNLGITKYDVDGPFKEIRARYNEYTKEQRRVRNALNCQFSSISEALQCYLSETEACEAIEQIKLLLNKARDYYEKSLFFGMFNPLLDLEYLDCASPFADNSESSDDRMSYFNYVVNTDAINPYDYLGTRPLKVSSHLWNECIKELDKALRPPLPSKRQSAKTIAAILHGRFPLIFGN